MLAAKISLLLVLAVAAALRAPWGGASARAVGLFEEGRLVPDLELPTIDGKGSVSLRDLAGKRVLLLQFASW